MLVTVPLPLAFILLDNEAVSLEFNFVLILLDREAVSALFNFVLIRLDKLEVSKALVNASVPVPDGKV